MSQPNKVAFSIKDQDLQTCLELVDKLCAILLPLLITLTPEERQEMLKMGDKTVAFVQKAYDYSVKNPDLVPPFMNVADMATDVKAIETLRRIFQPLSQLDDALSDTIFLSGSEAYAAALMFYKNAQHAAASNFVKAQTIYEDLAARFPKGKRSSAPPAAEAGSPKV